MIGEYSNPKKHAHSVPEKPGRSGLYKTIAYCWCCLCSGRPVFGRAAVLPRDKFVHHLRLRPIAKAITRKHRCGCWKGPARKNSGWRIAYSRGRVYIIGWPPNQNENVGLYMHIFSESAKDRMNPDSNAVNGLTRWRH